MNTKLISIVIAYYKFKTVDTINIAHTTTSSRATSDRLTNTIIEAVEPVEAETVLSITLVDSTIIAVADEAVAAETGRTVAFEVRARTTMATEEAKITTTAAEEAEVVMQATGINHFGC